MVCHAARMAGIDISGATFLFGGEPLTDAKLVNGCNACHAGMILVISGDLPGTANQSFGMRLPGCDRIRRGKSAAIPCREYPVGRMLPFELCVA